MTSDKSTRRLFSGAEKRAAYVAFDGKCVDCGCELKPGWHGDHAVPYSKGGQTDASNCEPRCEACNLKKGAKSAMPWPEVVLGYPPRQWQERAFEVVSRSGKRVILIYAVPGAGKTEFSASVAAAKIGFGIGARVAVFSPSRNLQESWADDFSKFGIELDPHSPAQSPDGDEFIGRSFTYAAMSKSDNRVVSADVEHIRQKHRSTVVILDEVHHLAENASWGDGVLHACAHASFILCLSGTPFRSDGNPIPFLEYDNSGKAIPDFTYTYAQSLQDSPQVCRPVYFPSYEGSMEWVKHDEVYRHSFSDELDEKSASHRLMTALWSEDWVLKQLKDAKEKLSQIRVNHVDAGGLIVAMNGNHAEFLSRMMRKVQSSEPLIITSDDPDAHAKLKAFRGSVEPWVIAIKMISEGVNIPRLRVCSYMTNVITEMFFRQLVGRIQRYVEGVEHQESYMYIPADKRLIDMALAMRDERILAIKTQADAERDEESDIGFLMDDMFGDLPRSTGGFQILGADGYAHNTITFDGETFTVDEIEAARSLARKHHLQPEVVAKLMRDLNMAQCKTNGSPHSQAKPAAEPLYARKKKNSSDSRRKKMISDLRARHMGHVGDDGEAYRYIWTRIHRAVGSKPRVKMTEQQQIRAFELLEQAMLDMERPSWL